MRLRKPSITRSVPHIFFCCREYAVHPALACPPALARFLQRLTRTSRGPGSLRFLVEAFPQKDKPQALVTRAWCLSFWGLRPDQLEKLSVGEELQQNILGIKRNM